LNAGKGTSHEPEDVVELSRERSGGKDADCIYRNDPVICNITKDKQLNLETFTSQISQRTFLPGDPLVRLCNIVPIIEQFEVSLKEQRFCSQTWQPACEFIR